MSCQLMSIKPTLEIHTEKRVEHVIWLRKVLESSIKLTLPWRLSQRNGFLPRRAMRNGEIFPATRVVCTQFISIKTHQAARHTRMNVKHNTKTPKMPTDTFGVSSAECSGKTRAHPRRGSDTTNAVAGQLLVSNFGSHTRKQLALQIKLSLRATVTMITDQFTADA